MTLARLIISGSSISFDQRLAPIPSREGSSPRGEIVGYSKRSRSNLMQTLSRLDTLPSHFLTLNFPPGVPIAPPAVKKALDNMGKRLKRLCPSSPVFWKLEFGNVYRPHLHLLGSFGHVPQKELEAWLFDAWREILDFADTNPSRIVEAKHVPEAQRQQVARYFAKADDARRAWKAQDMLGSFGRRWGVINRGAAKFAPQVSELVDAPRLQGIIAEVLSPYIAEAATTGRNSKLTKDELRRLAKLQYKLANGYDVALHLLPAEVVEAVKMRLVQDVQYGGVVGWVAARRFLASGGPWRPS